MDDQDYILFDQYLTGELSAEEVLTFEEKLKTDATFSIEFNLFNDVHSHLKNSIENETESNTFKDNLNSISENYFSQTKSELESQTVTETQQKTKTFTLIKYAMAACVALIIGISAFNQLGGDPTYGDYNSHEPMTVTRGSVKDLIQATKAFNNKEYEKASELLKTLLDNESENYEVKLYYAITNIELDNFKVADANLNEIANGNSAYKDKALWYSALSQLKQEKNKEVIILLKLIPEDADDYKAAQKLLKELD